MTTTMMMKPQRARAGRMASHALLGVLLSLAACNSLRLPVNEPLPPRSDAATRYGPGYSFPDLNRRQSEDVLAFMAFSGGGKRSAAFAHGALRGASRFMIGTNSHRRSLLDEVDLITAVSGGSFPAMHYGLYRERSFETFPRDFLYRDIEAYIWGTYLLPWNWDWLINPLVGSNDRMAEVYDALMFHGATYADLIARGSPLISVNATDIAGGVAFGFTQNSFDLLCSDLTRFPVARAVAASNGFPILFGPITLLSYRPDCGGARPPDAPPPDWAAGDPLSRRAALSLQAERYLDFQRTRYVHLMDGGIADNLALRTMIASVIALDAQSPVIRRLAHAARRVVLISVDGQAATDPTLGQQRVVTGLGQVFSAVSGTQIDAFNFESLVLARQQVERFVASIRALRCAEAPVIDGHPCDDVRGALVHISLAQVADPVSRARLQAIPTGLTIPRDDVDALVAAGEQQILENAMLHNLLDDLDPPQAGIASAAR